MTLKKALYLSAQIRETLQSHEARKNQPREITYKPIEGITLVKISDLPAEERAKIIRMESRPQ